MGNTLAIHWAATTFGTWLHGDPRGSWRQGRLIGPDRFLEAAARASMSADAVILDAAEREMVAKEFGAVVREQRHRIYAATIQAAHVHLVFAPLREDLTTVVARMKRRSAAAVLARRRQQLQTKMAGLDGPSMLGRNERRPRLMVPRSLWTAGKFPVFIFDEFHLCNAIEYVRDHNRRMGLPPDPFDWIESLYPSGVAVGERLFRHDGNVQPRL